MRINTLNIVDMRKRQGWSQEDLAAAAGISTRTVQRLESEGKGSLESAKAVAAAFNVSLDKVKAAELQWRHHRLIWKPLGQWFFWTMVIAVITAKTVKHGFISDHTGKTYVLIMMMSLFMLAAVQIGMRFYDEFGPYWKKWGI